MLTLDWLGKQAVVNHRRQVPFYLLGRVLELSVAGVRERQPAGGGGNVNQL